jgi:uncharacterized membrane protein
MTETLVNEMMALLQNKIPEELVAFIISLFPVLECRGGMIAARLMEIPFVTAFLLCYIGNMVPIPFILLFIKKIFEFLRRFSFFEKIISKFEAKAEKNADKILRYKSWGLLLFVAIPLPGTGGWTGALMAALLDIPFKRALPVITLGVLIAGFIMSGLTYGLFQMN